MVMVLLPLMTVTAETLPAGTPLFSAPSLFSEVKGVGPGEVKLIRGPFRGFTGQHPLAWYNDYYEVETPDGSRAFYTPDATIPARPNISPLLWQTPPLPEIRILLVLTAAVFWVALLVKFLRELRSGALEPGSAAEACYWVGLAVLLRITLGLLTTIRFGNVIPSAADDPGYYKTIADILRGDWTGPWNFTIGLGFFYLPFILALGAGEFYDIAVAFDYFVLLAVGPAALALGFLILRRIGLSVRQAGAAIMVQALWPFVFFHLENWNLQNFSCFFAFPPSPDAPYGFARYYSFCINAGFNAMSDTPGLLMLFAAIWAVLALPLRRRWALATGVLYGLVCMIRINYILLAPLLIFIALNRFSGSKSGSDVKAAVRELAWLTGLAAAGFLAVFGLQFYANIRQFGSPLTFGYVLHYLDYAPGTRPADGFTFATLMKGVHIRFLSEANLALWAPGIAALLLEKSRCRRTIIALWTVPLIWFFFGYSHTFCDARRFILPTVTAWFGVFAGLDFWRSAPLRHRAITVVLIAGAILLGTPLLNQAGTAPFLLNYSVGPEVWSWVRVFSWLMVAAAAIGGLYLFWRGSKSAGILVWLSCGLYFLAPPVLFAALLAAVLIRGLIDGVLLVRDNWIKTR